jgi:hypothetical protein
VPTESDPVIRAALPVNVLGNIVLLACGH